ncbi:MAG: hypothetical protein GY722_09860 [bacterium]|nr:hypothetical protein [bacterium]
MRIQARGTLPRITRDESRRSATSRFASICRKSRALDALDQGHRPGVAVQGDDRRTRIGTFLRQGSLDELPQAWSVPEGDMSIGG